jgi:hypothetical protein
MLVTDVEADTSFPGIAWKLYDALICPKEFMFSIAEEGADDATGGRGDDIKRTNLCVA